MGGTFSRRRTSEEHQEDNSPIDRPATGRGPFRPIYGSPTPSVHRHVDIRPAFRVAQPSRTQICYDGDDLGLNRLEQSCAPKKCLLTKIYAEHSIFVPPERGTTTTTTKTAAKVMSTPGSQNTDTEETNCTFCSSSSSSASSGQSNGECEQCEGSSRSADADCNTKGGLNDGVPSPIFSSDWQDSQTFCAEGGFLRQTESDVILHVPPGAVERNTQIRVHSSICADVDHIRHLMNLSEHEEVVSPLVEYWAGEGFEFQRPVTITLRHCLPADFDADMVQIYHLTRGHGSDLDLAISKIKKAVDLSEDGRLTMAASADVLENAQGNFSMEWTQQDLEGGGFYLFDSDTAGNVQIKTNRFCGYVCTFCHAKKKKNVELYAAGSGSSSDESRPVINVSVHVWDARLKIADFRKLYEIEADTREPVHLLEDLKDSLLYVRLRIIEETADAVRHCEDEHGQLVKPLQKGFDLPKILSCRKCLHKGKIKPISYKWLLKQYDTVQNNMSCFRFAIDLSHVAPETLKPSWTDTTSQARKERVTTTDLMVQVLPQNVTFVPISGSFLDIDNFSDGVSEVSVFASSMHFADSDTSSQRLPAERHREDNDRRRQMLPINDRACAASHLANGESSEALGATGGVDGDLRPDSVPCPGSFADSRDQRSISSQNPMGRSERLYPRHAAHVDRELNTRMGFAEDVRSHTGGNTSRKMPNLEPRARSIDDLQNGSDETARSTPHNSCRLRSENANELGAPALHMTDFHVNRAAAMPSMISLTNGASASACCDLTDRSADLSSDNVSDRSSEFNSAHSSCSGLTCSSVGPNCQMENLKSYREDHSQE